MKDMGKWGKIKQSFFVLISLWLLMLLFIRNFWNIFEYFSGPREYQKKNHNSELNSYWIGKNETKSVNSKKLYKKAHSYS